MALPKIQIAAEVRKDDTTEAELAALKDYFQGHTKSLRSDYRCRVQMGVILISMRKRIGSKQMLEKVATLGVSRASAFRYISTASNGYFKTLDLCTAEEIETHFQKSDREAEEFAKKIDNDASAHAAKPTAEAEAPPSKKPDASPPTPTESTPRTGGTERQPGDDTPQRAKPKSLTEPIEGETFNWKLFYKGVGTVVRCVSVAEKIYSDGDPVMAAFRSRLRLFLDDFRDHLRAKSGTEPPPIAGI